MGKTNPNGANQYTLDPRQKRCWDLYVNPKSETFGNAYQSAIKAGYEEDTAKQITVTTWFLEKTRRLNMLNKAEKVLDETLDMIAVDTEGKVDAGVLRIQTDVAKFVAERLGRQEYSTRVEHENTTQTETIKVNAITINIAKEYEEKLKAGLIELPNESTGTS